MASMFSARECIPIEYIEEQMQEYAKFDHLRANAEFLDWFVKDYKDNAMANYEWEADTPQPDSEVTRNSLRTDCTGCKFVGWYDTEFPCVNCIRKNKDYYTSEQTERKE